MSIEPVESITMSTANEADVLALLNEFASMQHLKPTTALKQYLLQTLPAKIAELKQSIKNETACQ